MRRSKLSRQLREERVQADLALDVDARITLARRLYDEAVDALRAAEGLSRAEAERRIAATRRAGRLPSKVAEWP